MYIGFYNSIILYLRIISTKFLKFFQFKGRGLNPPPLAFGLDSNNQNHLKKHSIMPPLSRHDFLRKKLCPSYHVM